MALNTKHHTEYKIQFRPDFAGGTWRDDRSQLHPIRSLAEAEHIRDAWMNNFGAKRHNVRIVSRQVIEVSTDDWRVLEDGGYDDPEAAR